MSQPAPTTAERRPWYLATAVRVLVVSGLAGAVLAFPAAWLWVRLSDPPAVPLGSDGGLLLGEQTLDQLAGATLWFFVIGLAFGVAAGIAVGWFGRSSGWIVVVAIVLLSGIGALLSHYLGVHVFGPDQRAEAAAAAPGDLVTLTIQTGTRIAYLGWPIGGLAGVIAAISCWRPEEEPQPSVPMFAASGQPYVDHPGEARDHDAPEQRKPTHDHGVDY